VSRPPLYVAVEGPIGVGKTTLVEQLRVRLSARLVLEAFEENPFLPLFYGDRERYAFQTQIFFLMSRFRQQSELIQPDLFEPNILSDYHLLKDRIFAQLTLADDELALYEQIYRALESQILQPDVVVYLTASQSALLERIDRRGRTYEKDFDRDYLAALARTYRDFFARYTTTRLLTVDTTELNIPADPSIVDGIYRELLALAERE
jgi:deoxyadenosine/deoxycytidine kinase